MWTAGCLDRNSREAEWAIPRHSDSCLLFVFQTIHLANKHEYHESNNKEVGQGVEENAVIEPAALASASVAYACPERLMNLFEKSEWPVNNPIGGIKTSETKELTVGQMAARERMKKCAAEWKATKAAGKVETGMKWPKYWSQCNKRLKEQKA